MNRLSWPTWTTLLTMTMLFIHAWYQCCYMLVGTGMSTIVNIWFVLYNTNFPSSNMHAAMNNFVISIAYTRKTSQAVTWRVGVVAWTIFNTWTALLSCVSINIVGPTIIRAGLTKGHVPHPASHKNDHVLKTMNQNSVEIRMQYITPCIQSLYIKYTISHKIQWLKV